MDMRPRSRAAYKALALRALAQGSTQFILFTMWYFMVGYCLK